MRYVRLSLVLALLISAAGFFAASAGARPTCDLPVFGPGADYHPSFDAASFTANVTNPYFPLPPGRVVVSSGIKDGKAGVNILVPSDETVTIDGVQARVVNDRGYLNGRLHERTRDYYSQDRCGNVWYFGEDTAELNRNGTVNNTDGSFHAGVDGAEPGVFMQAQPEVGRVFRQEYFAGQAEDTFLVLSLHATAHTPGGVFTPALLTSEETALEPGVRDHKFYGSGLGTVVEKAVLGPTEIFKLIDVMG